MYGILWRRDGQDFNSMFVCATELCTGYAVSVLFDMHGFSEYMQRGVSGVLTRLWILCIHITVHV
jgi:hypothetical protein